MKPNQSAIWVNYADLQKQDNNSHRNWKLSPNIYMKTASSASELLYGQVVEYLTIVSGTAYSIRNIPHRSIKTSVIMIILQHNRT